MEYGITFRIWIWGNLQICPLRTLGFSLRRHYSIYEKTIKKAQKFRFYFFLTE